MEELLKKTQRLKRRGVKELVMPIDDVIRLMQIIVVQSETIDHTNSEVSKANHKLDEILGSFDYARGL